MLAFSQEQSKLKNDWWDNMQLLKKDIDQTTVYKCYPHNIIFSLTSLIYEAIRKG